MHKLKSYQPFLLECGFVLPEIDLSYHTFGTLNAQKDNVIWVFHALTGNSDASEWWSGLIGEGKVLDTTKYFIICANMLGSCYGATNANSINPLTGKRYGKDFPIITVRDVVKSHQILQKHLNINKIYLGIGGSMGGQQALEWSIMSPDLFENICVMAAGAKMYPWAIALNETQRMALEADNTLFDNHPDAGKKGMEAARAIGLLSYRNGKTYNSVQQDEEDNQKVAGFRVTSYQRYQGVKLSNRFSALSYLSVTRTMDSHNVGRNRGGIESALNLVRANTLIIGIQSDMLFPIDEQKELANLIPYSKLETIESPFGHDGFLIENEKITKILSDFLKNADNPKNKFLLNAFDIAANAQLHCA